MSPRVDEIVEWKNFCLLAPLDIIEGLYIRLRHPIGRDWTVYKLAAPPRPSQLSINPPASADRQRLEGLLICLRQPIG